MVATGLAIEPEANPGAALVGRFRPEAGKGAGAVASGVPSAGFGSRWQAALEWMTASAGPDDHLVRSAVGSTARAAGDADITLPMAASASAARVGGNQARETDAVATGSASQPEARYGGRSRTISPRGQTPSETSAAPADKPRTGEAQGARRDAARTSTRERLHAGDIGTWQTAAAGSAQSLAATVPGPTPTAVFEAGDKASPQPGDDGAGELRPGIAQVNLNDSPGAGATGTEIHGTRGAPDAPEVSKSSHGGTEAACGEDSTGAWSAGMGFSQPAAMKLSPSSGGSEPSPREPLAKDEQAPPPWGAQAEPLMNSDLSRTLSAAHTVRGAVSDPSSGTGVHGTANQVLGEVLKTGAKDKSSHASQVSAAGLPAVAASAAAIPAQGGAGTHVRGVRESSVDAGPASARGAAASVAAALAGTGETEQNPAAVHGGLDATWARAGGAALPPGGSNARDAFAAMDAQPPAASPAWTHAGAQSAEAGFEDPALGWVGVRADLNAGAVHAAVVPSSAEAAQVLGSHLAGLTAHLAAQHVPVQTLTLDASADHAGAMQQGTGQGQQQDTAQGESLESRARSTASHDSIAGRDALAGGGSDPVSAFPTGTGTHISVVA